MEVISKREVKRKKKSHSSTFQKYHSHAGRKPSCILFLIVKHCGQGLGGGGGLGGEKGVGRGLLSKTHMPENGAFVVSTHHQSMA